MNTPLNCLTCGATFSRRNLKQKYCSATCRNKALYTNRKYKLVRSRQLSSITEQPVCSEDHVKNLETQIKAIIQQLEAQTTPPSIYHIELRKTSITQVLDQPYVDFYLDIRGNKTITIDGLYLITYSSDGALLSEQEIKPNDELLYLMEHNNITDIDLIPCGNKSLTRP
jgi:hypothetical protein